MNLAARWRARVNSASSSGVREPRSIGVSVFFSSLASVSCAGLGGFGQSVERYTARLSFVAAEILELRINREAIVHRREKRAIERQHERAPRASKSDVKEALHFLPAGERVGFFDFRFAIFLMQRGDYFVCARLADDRRITRRKSSDAAR